MVLVYNEVKVSKLRTRCEGGTRYDVVKSPSNEREAGITAQSLYRPVGCRVSPFTDGSVDGGGGGCAR
jgi:hypothetical protein